MAVSPHSCCCISRKSISHTPRKGKKNPSRGAKPPVRTAFCASAAKKTKKPRLRRGSFRRSQRSLTICLVLPKIISSTSCLMNFSYMLVLTLLSFIYFSLYYRRGKGKLQSSAFMILPKKLTVSSCKMPTRHLHFFPLHFIMGWKSYWNRGVAGYVGFC